MSQDYSKNRLVMSQNDINNSSQKEENKTPEKSPCKTLKSIQKELNPNISNYTYCILPGNNGKLIEKCLLNRNNWENANDDKKKFL